MMRTPFILILLCVFFLTAIVGPRPIYAQEEIRLTTPGERVVISPAFNPPILKGIKVHPEDPFRFDFIIEDGSWEVGNGYGREGGAFGENHYGDMPTRGLTSILLQGPKGQESVSVPKPLAEQQNQTPSQAPQVSSNRLTNESLKHDAQRLIRYFLASITVPEKDLWVNLSPYEKNRIIPESFGLTEMGRDLLAQDYVLKQITASLMYPEDEVGKKFWSRIYKEAAEKFHTTQIPVNTFNKVWIVPEKAVVYENAKTKTAYVVEAKLKVMLEQDYLATNKNSPPLSASGGQGEGMEDFASQIIREIIIPELTKEVNEGKNFAQLRQVYHSLILANWYKKKIRNSILAKVYADQNKVTGLGYKISPPLSARGGSAFGGVGGVGGGGEGQQPPSLTLPTKGEGNNVESKSTTHDPQHTINSQLTPDVIYQNYLQAFKKGVYNFIKEEQDPVTQKTIPRKYFSGGVVGAFQAVEDFALVNKVPSSEKYKIDHMRRLVVVLSQIPVKDFERISTINQSKQGVGVDQSMFIWFNDLVKDLNRFQYKGISIHSKGFHALDPVADFELRFNHQKVGYFVVQREWIKKRLIISNAALSKETLRGQGFFKALLVDINKHLPEHSEIILQQVINDRTLDYWVHQIAQQINTGSDFFKHESGIKLLKIDRNIREWGKDQPQPFLVANSEVFIDLPKLFNHYMMWCQEHPHDRMRLLKDIAQDNGFGRTLVEAGFQDLEIETTQKWGDIHIRAVKKDDRALITNEPKISGSNTGGIDLTKDQMEVTTEEGTKINLFTDDQSFEEIDINGLMIKDIQIMPVLTSSELFG